MSSLTLLLSRYGHHPHLHSFPTRRSSDLDRHEAHPDDRFASSTARSAVRVQLPGPERSACAFRHGPDGRRGAPRDPVRSEEHTSELQSLAYLVCRLLLEKKKREIMDMASR